MDDFADCERCEGRTRIAHKASRKSTKRRNSDESALEVQSAPVVLPEVAAVFGVGFDGASGLNCS